MFKRAWDIAAKFVHDFRKPKWKELPDSYVAERKRIPLSRRARRYQESIQRRTRKGKGKPHPAGYKLWKRATSRLRRGLDGVLR